MPKKGHRAASRQAQIQKKRRRGSARTQVFDAGPSEADAAARQASSDEGDFVEDTLAPRPSPAPVRRPRVRAAADAALTYPTIRPELTRIGVLTLAVVVVLAVLTVFLG